MIDAVVARSIKLLCILLVLLVSLLSLACPSWTITGYQPAPGLTGFPTSSVFCLDVWFLM